MSDFPRSDWAKLWQPPADRGDGETTEEIALRLGVSREAVRIKLHELARDGKLTVTYVRRRGLGDRIRLFTLYRWDE